MIDINTIQELLANAIWLVPTITALVFVLRTALSFIPDRFVPLMSVGVGICVGILFIGMTATGVFVGLMLGLTASGAYDAVKRPLIG